MTALVIDGDDPADDMASSPADIPTDCRALGRGEARSARPSWEA